MGKSPVCHLKGFVRVSPRLSPLALRSGMGRDPNMPLSTPKTPGAIDVYARCFNLSSLQRSYVLVSTVIETHAKKNSDPRISLMLNSPKAGGSGISSPE